MNTHRLSALVSSLAELFTDQYTVAWEPLPLVPGLPSYQFRPHHRATFRAARRLALTERGSRIYRASTGEPIPTGPGWSETDNGYNPEAWTCSPAPTAAPPAGGRYEGTDLLITLRPGTTDADARRVAEAYRELGLGESRLVRTARGHELLVTRTRGRWHERDSVL